MTRHTPCGLTPARQLLLAIAGITTATAGRAQTPAAPLRFEVASIKPTRSAGSRGGMQVLPGGGLRMDGVTLQGLIALAYDVRETQISGGPKWAGSDAYDVVAKAEHSTAADDPALSFAPGTNAWDRLRLRTQTLLAERFQLVVHNVSKESAGYALVVTKGGPRMRESTTAGPAGTVRSFGKIDSRAGSMHMLATVLTGFLGRPVEDRTGLTGSYDYKLEYGQESGRGGLHAGSDGPTETNPVDATGPSIFTAIQEQLGLKIETSRVATQSIVIERAQKPSAN